MILADGGCALASAGPCLVEPTLVEDLSHPELQKGQQVEGGSPPCVSETGLMDGS